MSGRKEKKIRKLVKQKIRYDYDKMLKDIKSEPNLIKVRWILGLIKRLFFVRAAKS